MITQDQLIEKFPEINLIKDVNLFSKTVLTLQEAMKLGGWSIADLDEIPFTLLIPKCPVSFRTHTRAVTQVAIKAAEIMQSIYAEYYQIKMDNLIAGALLHDVGKLLEYERLNGNYTKSSSGKLLRHPFSGAGLAAKIGLPDEIVHMIATHAKEGDSGYRSPEAVIIHHADFINFEPLRDELK